MKKAVHIPRDVPWLPPTLRKNPDTIRHTFRFSAAECRVMQKRKPIKPSVWSEKHRVVTMSVLPGKWKNEVTPYLPGIMDASFFPSVRSITMCKSPQTGGSECVNNCIGYAIDRQPGPVIAVYPDEKTSDTNSEDRIQPMITSSRRLRSYMLPQDDALSKKRIKLQHMPIYFAWARSASALANRPCRYAINDEVDKYPVSAGKRETDPILLTKARLTTYQGQEKHWIISTPTIEEGPIWQYFLSAQVRFDFLAKCPVCGVPQLMEFGQIKWPRGEKPDAGGKHHSENPETIESKNLAWYECPSCMAAWKDYDRDWAVQRGHWQARETGETLDEYLIEYQPLDIAFHIPSWISRFVPLSQIAAAFLRGQKSLTAFKDFHNKYKAEPWKQVIQTNDGNRILDARCDLPPQTVPEEAIALMCGIDVQKHGFWFVVRAFAPDMTSWLIHYGFLATWGDVEELLFTTAYPALDSEKTMRIARACVDTGGGQKYQGLSMTEETYWWLRDNSTGRGARVWGTKGASHPLAGKLQIGKPLDKTPSGKPLPGGLRIVSVDTDKMKDTYHYRIGRAIDGQSQGAYLHAETGGDYVDQVLAEEKQITAKGLEEWVKIRTDNHLLDCECLAMICADPEFPGGGVQLIRPPDHNRQKSPRPPAPPPGDWLRTSRDVERPGWLRNR